MTRSLILGTGMAVPDRIVTNDDLSTVMDTTDEWITQRTGIRQRHWVREGETGVDLAERASRAAIAEAGLADADIDAIVTSTPDHSRPAAVCCSTGLARPSALDVRAQCGLSTPGHGGRLHQPGLFRHAGGGPEIQSGGHGRHDARPGDGGDLRWRRRRCSGLPPTLRAAYLFRPAFRRCLRHSSGRCAPARCTTRMVPNYGRGRLPCHGWQEVHAVVRMPESVPPSCRAWGSRSTTSCCCCRTRPPAHLGDDTGDAGPGGTPGLQRGVAGNTTAATTDRARRMRARRTDQTRRPRRRHRFGSGFMWERGVPLVAWSGVLGGVVPRVRRARRRNSSSRSAFSGGRDRPAT